MLVVSDINSTKRGREVDWQMLGLYWICKWGYSFTNPLYHIPLGFVFQVPIYDSWGSLFSFNVWYETSWDS